MILGIAGLADIENYLRSRFPNRMTGRHLVQGMDAAAAILDQGRIVAAASQERFDRVKKSGRFPYDAIDYCLTTAGIPLHHLDAVCSNFHFARYKMVFDPDYYAASLAPDAIRALLARQYGELPPFTPIDHHDAHLHSALVSSPFDDDCLAVVMDAAGELGSTTVYHLADKQIKRLRRYPIHQSLGLIYSLVTQFLGFAPNEDEYKVMGMSSFGDPARYAPTFEELILLLPEGGINVPSLTDNKGVEDSLFFSGTARGLRSTFGFDGAKAEFQQQADVSAALQQRFTKALLHIVSHYRGVSGASKLLLSGGCAENCNAIGEIRRRGMFEQIHVAFASGDEGTALGAAAAHSFAQGAPVRHPSIMPFFGPAPDREATRFMAERRRLRLHAYATEQQMLEAAAAAIAEDRIVAICNGRMEYGARALGNRSLLALPSNPNNKERINVAIKKRQTYRPFAPAVLAEDAHQHFELNQGEAYPYMTMLTQVRAGANLPAVTHVDGTARVQTVDRQNNPAFYHLLTHVKKLTGVGVVLNTSYNVNQQPIVCSEQEAVETFIDMGIDALYMANMRLTRT